MGYRVTRMDRMPRGRSSSGILSMRVTLYPIGQDCSLSNRFRTCMVMPTKNLHHKQTILVLGHDDVFFHFEKC